MSDFIGWIALIALITGLGAFAHKRLVSTPIKEAYCVDKYETHIDVEKCKSEPYPWENK
jgi:hypothetical protein